jgi:hypothetical protein
LLLPALCAVVSGLPAAASPFATQVVSYDPGSTPARTFGGVPYTNASAALGSPERFTGEGSFPGVVSLFNPAYELDEIVSIGEGGHLTLRFDTPITNNPANLFGVDLILFGNASFIDVEFPTGRIGPTAGMFGLDTALLELSADGVTFVRWGDFTEGFFPTLGYLDSGPFDTTPGRVLSDFLRPVDPGLTRQSFAGLNNAQAVALYAGSGGGTPIDIARTGLSAAWYIRVSVADDNNPATSLNAEIDAAAVVPGPATAPLLAALAPIAWARRRRR